MLLGVPLEVLPGVLPGVPRAVPGAVRLAVPRVARLAVLLGVPRGVLLAPLVALLGAGLGGACLRVAPLEEGLEEACVLVAAQSTLAAAAAAGLERTLGLLGCRLPGLAATGRPRALVLA